MDAPRWNDGRPGRARSRWLLAALGGVLWALPSGCLVPDPRPTIRGPLPSRPQHPLGMTFLALRPRAASTQPRGTNGVGIQANHSSFFEANSDGKDRVVFDGEMTRASVLWRRGVSERVDVEAEVGLAYASSGFLDTFLENFHGALFLPDGGRGDAPRDQYDMSVRRDGEVLYELEEDRVGLTDTPLVVTGALFDEDRDGWGPGVAVRAAVELPTGSTTGGFGSGGFDFGAGLLLEKSTGRWTWTAAADVILPDAPDEFADAGVEIRDFLQLQGGSEFRWSNRCSLLLQLFLTTPYTRDIELEEINREIVDLGAGVAFDVGERSRLVVSFHEDIVAATGADFALRVGWSFGF